MQKRVTRRHVLAILSCALMAFVGILTETSLNVTFPTLMKQFHVGLATVQWTTTGYLLMIAVIMIPSSFLNVRFSARQLFIFSATVFILGSLVCAQAPSFWVLLAGRLLSSFGAGLSIPLMFNLVAELIPQQRWGFYIGLAGLVVVLAPTLGPTFGGAVVYFWNWRLIFHIVVCLALLVLILGLFSVEKYHPVKRLQFDWVRYAVIAAAMVSFSLTINRISQLDWLFWGGLLLTAVLMAWFVRLSKTAQKALFDIRVFQIRAFVWAFIAYLALQFVNLGTSFILPNYAQIVNHSTALVGGLILLPGSILAAVLNPAFGSWYDKKGAAWPLYTGALTLTIGCLLLAMFSLTMTTMMIIVFYAFMMVGRQMAFNNTLAEGMKTQKPALHSDATAVFQTGQQFAASLGTTITAAIVAAVQNSGGSYRHATAVGTGLAFAFLTAVGLLAVLSYFLMFKNEKR